MFQILLFMILLAASSSLLAVGVPDSMTKPQFDQLMQDISNWGRWGELDELGTLNLITPERRISAAQLVQQGITVSMALELNKVGDSLNTNPFEHQLNLAEFGGHKVAGDRYAVDYHGFAHSHMDGLPHFAHKGFFYNGVPFSAAKPTGTDRLGIHNAGVNGVFTRGVLVDMPKHLGIEFMEPGTAVTAADLESWEKANDVKIGSGDVLLIRTGRWVKVNQDGQWNFLEKAAGSQASIASWLKARDVSIIGSDGVSDVMPSGVEGLLNPLHELVLVGLGMPILDNLDLDALAAVSTRLDRVTFLYVGAPLRVKGGTGSPLNPLAIF
jgi:kynurenine formamidase